MGSTHSAFPLLRRIYEIQKPDCICNSFHRESDGVDYAGSLHHLRSGGYCFRGGDHGLPDYLRSARHSGDRTDSVPDRHGLETGSGSVRYSACYSHIRLWYLRRHCDLRTCGTAVCHFSGENGPQARISGSWPRSGSAGRHSFRCLWFGGYDCTGSLCSGGLQSA